MESLGAISENEWSSFNAMYTNEESEFMLQLLNNCPIPNDFHGSSSFKIPSFWPDHESMNMAQVDEGSINSLDNTNTNIYHLSLGSSSFTEGNSYFFPTSSDSNQILVTNNDSMSDYCMEGADIQGNMEEFGVNLPKADIQGSNLLLECEEAQLPEAEPSNGVEVNNLTLKSKKRSWNSGDVLKNKRNVKPRKNQKLNSTSKNDEDNNSAIPRLSSSSCCSEDDESNAGVSSTSDSKGAVAVNTNGKARTNRGSATDTQSLYARKRRERINERLRTLQNLVPNGTKVDISTMLDEAVQYVKFLQLQIKLLSSDDLWMYAPLAYNGLDLGLDLNIPMPR